MKPWRLAATLLLILGLTIELSGCVRKTEELGSAQNPIKFFIVPSVDVRALEDASNILKAYLEENTPYHFKVSIPPSFIAVVEAFGTKRADMAALNTYGYILAHEKYGVEARLTTVRNGAATYRSQFLVRADSQIKKIEDLNGKKVAYVDPASTSGFILPAKYLKDRDIKPKETMFAMRHDNVVSMIYQKQVDAGATFYVAPVGDEIQDARMLVKAQYPDIEKKVKILTLTDSIPNDPVVFRKDVPEDIKKKVSETLIRYADSAKGKETLQKLSGVTGLIHATDKDYDKTRDYLKAVGKSANESSP